MELTAQKRTELGKKSKRLRKTGKIPAVIFGKGSASTPITLDYAQFVKTFKEAGESTLVDVNVDGSVTKVLIAEVERHPVTGKTTHANLHKVNLKEKIRAEVPLKFVGESPLVKAKEAILLTLLDEVEVEALPTDLPHEIVVDTSNLMEIDQGVEIKDLIIDRTKVEIVGQEEDELVAKLDYAEMKEEEAPAEPVDEQTLIANIKVEKEKEEAEEEGEAEEGKDKEKGKSKKEDKE